MSSHCYSKPHCLTIVFTGSELNPQRQTFCLRLLPSWGASIHHWWARRSFSQEDQEKTSPQSPYSPDGGRQLPRVWGRSPLKEVRSGCWGAEELYWDVGPNVPPVFVPERSRGTHCAFGSERYINRLADHSFCLFDLLIFFLATMGWGRKEFPPCYYFT